ncbi:retrovirus-related pol polyprotein from transposon TNT 1-94 [Tanacetum coccineum]
MTEKMNDPIAVANKQNCWTINYKKLNALYKDFVPQKELSVEQKYFPSSSIPSVKIPVSKNMPSESPLIKELDKIKVCFEKLSLLIQQNCKRASIFYTSPAEIQINDFCQDQVKPILNELKVYLEFFRNLFQRDIKEMKDVFESTESELDELEKQNDLLKDQLLEASLKQDVELCVLINHECVDKILNAELEKVKKKSFEIQEGLQARIKILEKDVQRCEKQSVDFQLKLQHEKEKQKWDSTSKNKTTIPLDYSWISKMEKLEDENVSLDFKVQSLIKERDNAKMEYKKLFDSIKKTRSQTQKEMDELIVHVSEKTYAYGAIRAENQNLLSTISELKTRLEKVEKGKSVNTKFDKTNGYQSLLCVTPLNKHAFQKKTDVPKTEENHVVSKPVTLQTSPTKQTGANQNTHVIRPGMYRVVTTQESQTNKTKSALSSTGMNATSRVRRPMSRDSHVAHSVLDNSKKAAKNVAVYVRKNKQTDNTSANVIPNKENVIDVDVANASKAKTLLCVSCMKNVLIPCHDKCVAKHKLNVRSNVRRTFSTNSRPPKSSETTFVAPKTRFSEKKTQSKTLDTTFIVSKSKIDVESASKAKDKVSSASRIKQRKFIKLNVHNTRSSEKPSVSVKKWVVKLPSCPCAVSSCVADLEVAFRSNTCYVRNLQGDDFLIGGRDSNLYTISISDMAASSPVCLMSKATSTKSWLCHRRLSHLNFGTINDLTKLDLVDGLPKFKYGKDHLCSAYKRGKSKKASHQPKLVPSDHSKLELCGPMRVASINGKKYIRVIVDDYSRYTWVYFLRSKDETLEIIKKFITQAQLNYKAKACKIRTDNERFVKRRCNGKKSSALLSLTNDPSITFDQFVDASINVVLLKIDLRNEATKKNTEGTAEDNRSLPYEWDTHVVVWMNKPDFDTMGLDDLYNNFKIVEQKVKKSAGDNNDDKNLAFLTTSGASSTNNIIMLFLKLVLAHQRSQLVHEDLEQLHDDDLEEMDLKWNMALLSMRERKFYQRTGRKIIIDGSSTAGYVKSKVECFNCHKIGHFAKECRTPRSKDNKNWNQGAHQRQELKLLFSKEIALLKRSVGHKEYLMGLLRTELEKVKEEKEGFEFKIAKFEKSAKDLDDLLASQPYLNSGLRRFIQPEVNELWSWDSSLKPTTGCDKESDNSKENTDDSLKQQQKTDSKTSSVKSPLKVDKDWKEKFFCPANHVREEEPKKARENNDAPIIEDWRQIQGFIDSGCSRQMTGNIFHLSDFKDFVEVMFFGGGASRGRILLRLESDWGKSRKELRLSFLMMMRCLKMILLIGEGNLSDAEDAVRMEVLFSAEISTAVANKRYLVKCQVFSTAEENISTAGRIVTYRRRSEEQRTRKDKGKEIMTESKPKKKSKKELE